MSTRTHTLALSVTLLISSVTGSVTAAASSAATSGPALSAAGLRAAVEYLADDACEGRLTGTPGATRAAEFISTAFQQAGLRPAPGLEGYYQPFTFTSGVRLLEPENTFVVSSQESTAAVELGRDFVPLTFSGNGFAEGEVVFVGYGLVEPVDNGYDSYRGLDVDGKIVLCLRDIPEEVSAERRQELALYAGDRYKAKLAADRGATAFLLVIGPNSPNGEELIQFRESDRSSSVPIPAVSVTGSTANRILVKSQTELQTLQDALDGGELNPHAGTKTGHAVRLQTELEKLTGTCRNVVGLVPPSEGIEEYVLVGAHYDHIGTGEGLGSLARTEEEAEIHNGADDNASGTAMVLELAASLAGSGEEPHRGLIFACWSGEELGLVGSTHFAENPPVALDKIACYINFDMVGRLRENKLIIQAVGSSSSWKAMIERRNIPAGFDLSLQNDPYLPTDLTSFYMKTIPGLAFFTDLHDDYNRPSDDAETLNYDGMERIAHFTERLIRDAAEPDRKIEYTRVEQSAPSSSRMQRRVATGVVPDFSASGDSQMLVADVRPGGPAEEAGVRGGDIIVEFAGKSVASLQDYSDALSAAKPGVAVPIVVMRDGERITLTITPQVRGQ
jgi:hypothetical protein